MKPAAVDPRDSLADLEALDQPGMPRLYTLPTVADALGASPEQVRGWADRGDLPTVQIKAGGTRYVTLAEMKRLAALGFRVDPRPLLDAD